MAGVSISVPQVQPEDEHVCSNEGSRHKIPLPEGEVRRAKKKKAEKEKVTKALKTPLYTSKKDLGGAIRADVRQQDVYTPGFDLKSVLRTAALLKGAAPPKEYLHGVIDMIPRNQLGWHTYGPMYTSENEFHRGLMRGVSGRGASRDHPTVVRAVNESLKHMPELQNAYMRA